MNRKWFLLACLLAGCGSAAGNTYDPPLANPIKLNGRITTSSVDLGPINLHAALVWGIPSRNQKLVAQDVEVKLDLLPSTFALEISHLPPKEAALKLFDAGSSIGRLLGVADGSRTLVSDAFVAVYEDTNGNGKLDFLAPDATSSPDRILGISLHDDVIFTTGDLPTLDPTGMYAANGDWTDLQIGFQIDHHQTDAETTLVPGCDPICAQGVAQHYLPINADVNIELTGDPSLASHLCVGGNIETLPAPPPDPPCFGSNRGQPGCPAFDVPPPGAEVACNADGTAFTVRWVPPVGRYLCAYGPGTPHLVGGHRPPGSPVPDRWPCP